MNIAIPQYFALYNTAKVAEDDASIGKKYAKLTETFGRASECIGCGQCQEVCPQQLPIIASLKKIVEGISYYNAARYFGL